MTPPPTGDHCFGCRRCTYEQKQGAHCCVCSVTFRQPTQMPRGDNPGLSTTAKGQRQIERENAARRVFTAQVDALLDTDIAWLQAHGWQWPFGQLDLKRRRPNLLPSYGTANDERKSA